MVKKSSIFASNDNLPVDLESFRRGDVEGDVVEVFEFSDGGLSCVDCDLVVVVAETGFVVEVKLEVDANKGLLITGTALEEAEGLAGMMLKALCLGEGEVGALRADALINGEGGVVGFSAAAQGALAGLVGLDSEELGALETFKRRLEEVVEGASRLELSVGRITSGV